MAPASSSATPTDSKGNTGISRRTFVQTAGTAMLYSSLGHRGVWAAPRTTWPC